MTQSASSIGFSANGDKAESEQVAHFTAQHFQDHCQQVWQRTDRMFAGLMALQWLAGIGVALWITPLTWIGATSSIHFTSLPQFFLEVPLPLSRSCLFFCVPGRRLPAMSSPSLRCWYPHYLFTSLAGGLRLISTFSAPWRFSPSIGTGVSLSRRRL